MYVGFIQDDLQIHRMVTTAYGINSVLRLSELIM